MSTRNVNREGARLRAWVPYLLSVVAGAVLSLQLGGVHDRLKDLGPCTR